MIQRPALAGVLLSAVTLGTFAGCSEDPAVGVVLEVTFDAALAVTKLELTARIDDPATTIGPRPLADSAPLVSGAKIQVLLPDAWADREARFALRGLDEAGAELAAGSGTATPRANDPPVVVIELLASCGASCTEGEDRCVGDQRQRCVALRPGCLGWSPPEDCPAAEPFCSAGQCAASCSDECKTDQRRCASVGAAQVCGDYDSDDCLEWGPAVACSPSEACAEGQCVLDCDGKPCACQPGETKPCADQGECKGGVRKCEGGQYGECQWQVGKQPEICDGKDNDCNGTEDDADQLVAPACAKQQGVCKGAVQRCGGTKGWLPCEDADYAAFTLLYEPDETSCDSEDNDCDGTPDEPSGCCQPDCANKVCGADNGCEGTCQSGICPANQSCQAGSCSCEHLSCGGACCASGEVCSASDACCTKSCGARKCGPDPACGLSCGNCTGAETCNDQGQCVDSAPSQIVVAVANKKRFPDFGGVAGADFVCGGSAVAAGYSGTWKAMLCQEGVRDVRDMFTGAAAAAPVVNLSGQQLFSSWSAVFNSSTTCPEWPYTVSIDTFGTAYLPSDWAWSGCNCQGRHTTEPAEDSTCDDWTFANSGKTAWVLSLADRVLTGGFYWKSCSFDMSLLCVRTAL